MNQITNREWASLILVCLAISPFLLIAKWRRGCGPSFLRLLVALWSLAYFWAFYFAYCLAVILLAWRIGIWNTDLTKDTVLLILFVGLPLVFSVTKFASGNLLLRRVALESLGISAILTAYVQLESLSLWAEFLIQLFAVTIALVAVGAGVITKDRRLGAIANGFLTVMGVCLLAYTTKAAISEWTASDWSEAGWSLALSVWLPLALLPFLYVSGFFIVASSALTMALFRNGHKQHRPKSRLAGYLGLRFSLKLANEFIGDWRLALGNTEGFREGLRVMKGFRQAVKERDKSLKTYKKHMDATHGSKGFDQDGLVMDRREFHVTKERLDDIYWAARANYQEAKRGYNAGLLELLPSLYADGLPDELSIQISKDCQSWMAWRQTPSGLYLGMGGTPQSQEEWQFDGSTPPSFPQANSKGWKEVFDWEERELDPRSSEWRKDDEPPALGTAF